MKTAKVQKLLQKTANANGIEIDVITGAKKDIVLYGQDFRGFDVAISAGRDKSGSVNEISYVNYGADISSAYDDLFIFAEVDNAKKFVKDIGVHSVALLLPLTILIPWHPLLIPFAA